MDLDHRHLVSVPNRHSITKWGEEVYVRYHITVDTDPPTFELIPLLYIWEEALYVHSMKPPHPPLDGIHVSLIGSRLEHMIEVSKRERQHS